MIEDLFQKIKRSKRVYILGNGGSYANAMHICNDLLAHGIKAFTIDPATLSAFANDYGWEVALERWVRAVGEPGDLLIAMSGSGMSKNILNAIHGAQVIGMDVYKIFGNERHECMDTLEESQLSIVHVLKGLLKP